MGPIQITTGANPAMMSGEVRMPFQNPMVQIPRMVSSTIMSLISHDSLFRYSTLLHDQACLSVLLHQFQVIMVICNHRCVSILALYRTHLCKWDLMELLSIKYQHPSSLMYKLVVRPHRNHRQQILHRINQYQVNDLVQNFHLLKL